MPQAVIMLDSSAFQSAEDVLAVLQCVPSQDEGNMLQSYIRAGGKLQGLSDAELFCLDLMKVSSPFFDARNSSALLSQINFFCTSMACRALR